MTIYDVREISPQEQAAVEGLERCIHDHYPDATFDVTVGGEPDGVYLTVTVDLEDTGEVIDHVLDQLLKIQFEEGLFVYLLTARPSRSSSSTTTAPGAVG